jgi:hypothetical protein
MTSPTAIGLGDYKADLIETVWQQVAGDTGPPTGCLESIIEARIKDDCLFYKPFLMVATNAFDFSVPPGGGTDFTRDLMYANLNIAFIKSIRNCLCGSTLKDDADLVPVANFILIHGFLKNQILKVLKTATLNLIAGNIPSFCKETNPDGSITVLPWTKMKEFMQVGQEMRYDQLRAMIKSFEPCLARSSFKAGAPTLVPSVG